MAPEEVQPFTLEERVTIAIAREYFWYFLQHVYLKSFEGWKYQREDGEYYPFEFGQMHFEWALLVQMNPRLCLMAPRLHLKSTVLAKGFAFWQMFRVEENRVTDILYFSYKATLAQEQVEDLLRMVRSNPYCRFWHDLKPYGRSMIDFLVDFGDGVLGEVTLKGEGIMAATRGRHPKVTICDDILSDFSNPLSSADLRKIGRIFRQAIMSLPANPSDPLLVIGTPQSYDDILYSLASSEDWMWMLYPAIVDEKARVVQWPEKFPFERLKKIQRSIGPTAFEVEFQLLPVSITNQFFTREEILGVTDLTLEMWNPERPFEKADLSTYGGCDVGQLVHPSHVVIFLELPSGTLVQLYEKFLDQMRYPEQVKKLNQLAEVFHLSRGYFDATFNVLDDRGLHTAWRGRVFSRKLKADMATLFEKRVFAQSDEPGIILLNDPRQINQITVVDRALKAATTVEGHGDAFWSCGLAVKAAEDGPGIVEMGLGVSQTLDAVRPGVNWAKQMSR